jgi:MerR family transcriptional regulator, light-induced transcriptional regulator
MYTIREASTRSGVGIPLLRAWERRYKVVEPGRTDAGYRLYDDDAIARLRAMRSLIASGWSARQAADRVRSASGDDLGDLAGEALDIGTPPTPDTMPADDRVESTWADALVARLVDAARAIDGPALESALDEAFGIGRFEAVADRVVMPALRAIGEAWAREDVDVAGEHAASHAVLRRLAMAYEAAGEPPLDRTVLVGLGPGSHHELGAFAFAVAARRSGLPILYLGPNLPARSWVAAANRRGSFAAVVGVPTRSDVRGSREVILAMRAARPDLLLAVGGDEAARVARDTGAMELPAGSISTGVAALHRALEGRDRPA